MGYLMKRFKGHRKNFKDRRNGGIGAFTPDNVPVFDWIMPNAYMIADSNHGFKMTGVGKLVAKILAGDNKVAELEPFAFSRFAKGKTFGASHSHCRSDEHTSELQSLIRIPYAVFCLNTKK